MLYEGLALADGGAAMPKASTLKVLGAGIVSLAASITAGYYTRKSLQSKGAAIANSAGVGVGLATDVALSTLAAKTILKKDYAALYADPTQKTMQTVTDYAMPTYDKVRGLFKNGNATSLTVAPGASGNTGVAGGGATMPPAPTPEQAAALKAEAEAAAAKVAQAKIDAETAAQKVRELAAGIPGVTVPQDFGGGILNDEYNYGGGGNAAHL